MLSFSFATRREFILPKFTEDLQHNTALKPTVFKASNIGVNSSTAGAKTYVMIRGAEDLQLIVGCQNYCMLYEIQPLFRDLLFARARVLCARSAAIISKKALLLFDGSCSHRHTALRCPRFFTRAAQKNVVDFEIVDRRQPKKPDRSIGSSETMEEETLR
jgi:hypothetical protein